jgi:hypothetical protein
MIAMVSALTRGHPAGEAMRACLLAAELTRRAGLDERRRGEVYIYAKRGVSTRVGLAMFAMRYGLTARTGPGAGGKID